MATGPNLKFDTLVECPECGGKVKILADAAGMAIPLSSRSWRGMCEACNCPVTVEDSPGLIPDEFRPNKENPDVRSK